MNSIALVLVWLSLLVTFAVSGFLVPRRGRTDGEVARDAMVLAVGGLFPLVAFLLSCFPLELDSRLGCPRGWVDCFALGKLALTPLVLWAIAAFRVAQVLRPEGRLRAWVPTGLLVGATVSTVCFVHAHRSRPYGEFRFLLVIPLYTAAWYWILCVKAYIASRPNLIWSVVATLASLPFWLLSIFWSWRFYWSLPENTDCFVVTAALGGHESVVGPLQEVTRGGESCRANRQLVTLWRFESLWHRRAPRSHARFRAVYNRLGPWVARRIRTPLVADMAYLLIKPVELVARAIVSRHGRG